MHRCAAFPSEKCLPERRVRTATLTRSRMRPLRRAGAARGPSTPPTTRRPARCATAPRRVRRRHPHRSAHPGTARYAVGRHFEHFLALFRVFLGSSRCLGSKSAFGRPAGRLPARRAYDFPISAKSGMAEKWNFTANIRYARFLEGFENKFIKLFC